MWIWALDVTSQSLQVVSSDPEAIRRVSGENIAEFTQLVWALIVNINLRSYNWKTFRFLSSEPVSSSDPSSERATDLTGAEWLLMTWENPSTLLDHTLTVWSAEADTMVFPFGVIHTLWTAPLCPTKRNGLAIGLKFQTITVPSSEPEITYLRLELKQEEVTPSLWPLNERLSDGSATCPARALPPIASGFLLDETAIEPCELWWDYFILNFIKFSTIKEAQH